MAEIGKNITHAAQLLKAGELVAIPTETVYGLAANAFNKEAVAKIFEVKNRPTFDPLIVHVANLESINDLVLEMPKSIFKLLKHFSPGPLTVILPKKDCIPDLVSSGLATVAIRIPSHPLTLELLQNLSFPLAAPSANPFTYVSPTTAQHVAEQLGDKIPYILDGGACKVGLESTIIRLYQDQIEILRPGGISQEELQELSEIPVVAVWEMGKVVVPGQFKKHYAPSVKTVEGSPNSPQDNKVGAIRFCEESPFILTENQYVLSRTASLTEAAQNLFEALRSFDKSKEIKKVFVEKVPDQGIGRAINDRLSRAISE